MTLPTTTPARTGERADLLATLATRRALLRQTLDGVTDQDAARRTTVSELCLGGLIKHVAMTESQWADFIEQGPAAMAWSEEGAEDWSAGGADGDGSADGEADAGGGWEAAFQLLPVETVAEVLERYEAVARRTDELIATLPDLEVSHPLPSAPWFEPGASWSARRVLLHIIAETSQHAGHADILREAIDGRKSMG